MEILRHWTSSLPDVARTLEEHRERLLEGLSETKPTVPPSRYIEDVRSAVGPEIGDVERPLSLLMDLYVLMDLGRLAPETFLDEVDQELEALDRELGEGQADAVLAFLEEGLQMHETVGAASKAGHLWLDNERVYCSSRILSDLRPIFDPPDAEQPQAFLAMHELKLTYHPSGDFDEAEEFRIQLDSRHLRKLRSEIKRALDKEETLLTQVRSAGLEVLSTGGDG